MGIYNTYTVSNNSSTVSNTVLYNPGWSNGTIYTQPYELVFHGDPVVEKTAPEAGFVLSKETPEAWLRRRVEEICWRPA